MRISCTITIGENGNPEYKCTFKDDGKDDTTINYYFKGKLVMSQTVSGDGSESIDIAKNVIKQIESTLMAKVDIDGLTAAAQDHQLQSAANGGHEATPATHPNTFEPWKGSSKRDKRTGEIWEKDQLHKDHYEVYRNDKDYENGIRSREVWADGRTKGYFKR